MSYAKPNHSAVRRFLKNVPRNVEWPTVFGLLICYVFWGVGTTWFADRWLPLAIMVTSIATAFHSSLSHEALHGHPTRSPFWNAVLVFPALSVTVPYLRFKDTHMAHHRDSILTDPYDDPETNYLDPIVWEDLPAWWRTVLCLNNTLAGRLVFGPVIGTYTFLLSDVRQVLSGDRRVAFGWALHIPALALVCLWMACFGSMPIWAWFISVYAALSLLKIRTFLEHRAFDFAPGRTVVIEDTGPLSVLFLNNNLHVVHHMHAKVPWYRLPALYRQNKDQYLSRNCGYSFPSYATIFRLYLLKRKDPVAHPLWPKP